jgi:hypothetical protein
VTQESTGSLTPYTNAEKPGVSLQLERRTVVSERDISTTKLSVVVAELPGSEETLSPSRDIVKFVLEYITTTAQL